jgi:hypothetical protein
LLLLLKHDPEGGGDRYLIKAMGRVRGQLSIDRILDLLSPTPDRLAVHWRDRCRERMVRGDEIPDVSMN